MKQIILVLFLALFLRLVSLNQSLWLDEAVSANTVKNYSYQNLIIKFSPTDFHPPFYYLILKSWTSVFGYSEISLRFPSIIFSLITIFIIYKLAGIWPSLFLATNPLLIYYSQEARMYSLITLFVTLCLYFFQKKKYFLFNIFAFLSFLTFYGSIFFFLALSLYLLFTKKYRQIFTINIGLFLAIILVSPLLVTQLQHSQGLLAEVTNWNMALGKVNLKNLILIPIKFTSGRISFYPKIAYYLLSGLWAIYFFFLILKNSFSQKFYSFLFFVTLIIGTIFSIFTPMFSYFRFIYILPILVLIIPKKNFIIPAIFTLFSLIYLLFLQFHREDWRSLSYTLNNSQNIYLIASISDPLKYYRSDLIIKDLKTTIPTERQIVIIPYATDIHGLDYKSILTKNNYHLTSIKSFRELSYQYWSK